MTALFPIPDSWAWTTLGEIAEVVGGVTKDTKKQSDPALQEVPYLRVANVQRGYLDLREITKIRVPEATLSKLRLLSGDVLLNEGGDRDKLGRGWIWEGQIPNCIHQNHVFRARLPEGTVLPKFLALYINDPARQWFDQHAAQSVNLASISLSMIKQLPVPLPPLDEQVRIVAAIEGNLSRLSAASFAVDTANRRSKKFTASVLETAATGRLSSTLKTDSDVTELIEQSRDLLTGSGYRKTPGRRERELPPDAARTIAPFDLPSSWRWVPWRDLGQSRNGGAFPSSYYQDKGIKLIRPGNLHQSGRVVWSPNNTRFLPEKFASIKPDLVIRGRALILNLTAQSLRDEFLGRACVTESSEAALLNQRLAWLIPARIDLEYISIVFRSPIFRRFVARLNTGSLIQHMFTWQVDQFQVPVPPLEEQHRIVACVSELFDGADRMTKVAVRSQRKAQALRVQLLSDAFSGRLVPQDPMEEPVSVLVARIRAELMARPRSQRRRGMTKFTPQEETLL